MKKFKDLQVGDTVFIGFKKKVISKIVSDEDDPNNGIVIYISKDEFYYVYGHSSVDFGYDINKWIITDKEAMVEYFSKKLMRLEIDYKNRKSRYKKWLEKAKQIED